MSIPVQCKSCGHAFKAKEKYAGRRGACPQCGATVYVPAIEQASATSSSGESGLSIREESSANKDKSPAVTLACGDCGHRFKAHLQSTARDATCPGCGVELTIPAKSKPKSKPAAAKRPAVNEDSRPSGDLWDDLPAPSAAGGSATIWFGSDNMAAADSALAPAPQLPKKPKQKKTSRGLSFDNPVKLTMFGVGGTLAVLLLGYGAISGKFLIAVELIARFVSFVCYVIVMVRMFQNKRTGLALFSLFGWVIGLVVMVLMGGVAIATSSESSSPETGIAMLLGGMFVGVLIVGISVATPYFLGWANVNEWGLGGVMLAWTACTALWIVLGVATGTSELTDESAIADSTNEPFLNRGDGDDVATNTANLIAGQHAKLGDVFVIPRERAPGQIVEFDVQAEYSFSPSKTDPNAQYYFVVEIPNTTAQVEFTTLGQGTLAARFSGPGAFAGSPRINIRESRNQWICWIEIQPRDSDRPRERVSEPVRMHLVVQFPPARKNFPMTPQGVAPRSELDEVADASEPPSKTPAMPSERVPKKPEPERAPKELDLDLVLTIFEENDEGEVRRALRWLDDQKVDEQRRSEVAAQLAELIDHSDNAIQREAMAALSAWGTDEQIPAWIEVLENGSPSLRNKARDALAATKNPQAAEALALLMEKDRFGASRALKQMGPVAESAVIIMLEHPEPFIRSEASKILGEIGGKDSMRALKKLARDPSSISRSSAEKAFYQIEFREKQAERRKPSPVLERVD